MMSHFKQRETAMHDLNPTPWIGALLLTLVMAATPADATTVRVAGLPELIDGAALIVEGRVTAVRSVTLDVGPGVFTEYQLDVATVHKGAPPQTIHVRVPGGKAAGREVAIEGMPALPTQRHLLLMLEPLPRAAWVDPETPSYLPLGLHQGVFALSDDGASFSRPTGGAQLVYVEPQCTGGEHVARFEADDLRAGIKRALAAPGTDGGAP